MCLLIINIDSCDNISAVIVRLSGAVLGSSVKGGVRARRAKREQSQSTENFVNAVVEEWTEDTIEIEEKEEWQLGPWNRDMKE